LLRRCEVGFGNQNLAQFHVHFGQSLRLRKVLQAPPWEPAIEAQA
jgi:hypothetical protein